MKIRNYDGILRLCNNSIINEPMLRHTTIGIGGAANVFCNPTDLDELISVVRFAEIENEVKIIGNGSNLLVSDNGYDGVVVCTKGIGENIVVHDSSITIGASSSLSKLINTALLHELGGIEWACGIPGTVGGVIYQNAGAFGRQISDIVDCVVSICGNQIIKRKTVECEFGYRQSIFQTNKEIIIEATFNFQKSQRQAILNSITNFAQTRNRNQPHEPSAGSVFKKSVFPAGFMIEKVGLKGYRIGDAMISNKHSNFIVNMGSATAKQVLELMDIAKNRVLNEFGTLLEPEIEIMGEI